MGSGLSGVFCPFCGEQADSEFAPYCSPDCAEECGETRFRTAARRQKTGDVDIVDRLDDYDMCIDAIDDAIGEILRLRGLVAELERRLAL